MCLNKKNYFTRTEEQMNKNPTLMLSLCVLALIGATLACGPQPTDNNSEEVSLQQTSVSLQLTQTAMSVPPDEPDVTELSPEATEETPPAVEPDICYEGICFSFDDSIAESVTAVTVPAEFFGDDAFPGANHPTYYEFTFNGYPLVDKFHAPILRVYPTADYAAMEDRIPQVVAELFGAIGLQTQAGVNTNLAFLPFWNAAQMFTASSSYFDFQSGSGVRYLTMFGQAFYPIDNHYLFYTYQGVTSDGAYYVSAIMPVSNPALPERGEDTITDWNAFADNWNAYIFQAVGLLQGYTPNSFTPQLPMLDAMMASLSINR